MFEPTWKRLVEDLRERGFESKYLDRLMERLSPEVVAMATGGGWKTVQRELIEEMAYALQRSEDKVNLALLELDVAAAAIQANREADAVAPLEDEYEQRRLAAMRARWEFMVHREAIGMIVHDVLEELYPIPRRREAPDASHA